MPKSGCQRRREKRERIDALQRVAAYVLTLAGGTVDTLDDGLDPIIRSTARTKLDANTEAATQGTDAMRPRPRHATGVVEGDGNAGGSGIGGTDQAVQPYRIQTHEPTPTPDEPYDPPNAKRPQSERMASGLTRLQESQLNARAVLGGWVQAEFPIHKTATELLAEREARGGHLTLAEELAVANAAAAKKLPNLAPLAARAGAAMALTNARIEQERARARAFDAAADVIAAGDVEGALDLVEAALIASATNGDRHAQETFLRARGRSRGYVDRREVVNANMDLTPEAAAEVMGRLGINRSAGTSIAERVAAMPDEPLVLLADGNADGRGARAPRHDDDDQDGGDP